MPAPAHRGEPRSELCWALPAAGQGQAPGAAIRTREWLPTGLIHGGQCSTFLWKVASLKNECFAVLATAKRGLGNTARTWDGVTRGAPTVRAFEITESQLLRVHAASEPGVAEAPSPLTGLSKCTWSENTFPQLERAPLSAVSRRSQCAAGWFGWKWSAPRFLVSSHPD